MGGRYLLDTNIIIAALASDADVLNRIDDADECFVSTIVFGEMLYGAFNSTNVTANVERLRAFIDRAGFIPCDDRTAELYGEIKTSLRQQGTPIPDNDIWIAASALQHSLVLVTRDVHFDEVNSLRRARW
jgi:tRNA(fMet)-specific endonuclease VapC